MGTITIVGLGPGAVGHLSLETMGLLKNCQQVILRTAVHPSVSELEKEGVNYTSCDDLYEQGASFEEVYGNVVARVLAAAQKGDVVYAVPGSPLVAERTVVMLREQAKEQGVKLVIKPSMSFLDLAYVELGIDPIAGLRIIDAQDFAVVGDAGNYPLMITQVYSQLVASDLKIALMDTLDDDYEIYFLRNLGLPDEECRPIKLFELDRQPHIDHLTSAYIPPMEDGVMPKGIVSFGDDEESDVEVFNDADEELVDTDSFDDVDIQPLEDVMRTLREPGGCPWDREQTHASIRSNMIEEVYEYLEAVDNDDVEGMREELGDVLMQIVFHARMAEEAGRFDLQDVIDEVVDKLIRRHPHVFGDVSADTSEKVLSNWDKIKNEEKSRNTVYSSMKSIPPMLPSLMRARKIGARAAKVGFDFADAQDAFSKIEEETLELKNALGTKDAFEELGDLLFSVANVARMLGINPEEALNYSNNKFICRFGSLEQKITADGKNIKDLDAETLNEYYILAKNQEKM